MTTHSTVETLRGTAARPQRYDVLVAGRGPAGCLAAAALARRGLRVALVGPAAAWTQRLAVWTDELAGLGLGADLYDFRWDRVAVRLSPDSERVLARPYGRVDGSVLRRALEAQVATSVVLPAGVVIDGWVACIRSKGEHHLIDLADGTVLAATLVVDATGGAAGLSRGTGRPATAFQTAWGMEVDATVPTSLDPSAMLLMDWTGAGAAADARCEVPSFLYAMNLGGDRWFFEETALVARPAVDLAILRRRLEARLDRMGVVTRGQPVAVEQCTIPMDLRPPATVTDSVPFGVAGGAVHPTTGYSLAFSARAAEQLADAASAAIASGETGLPLAQAIWASLRDPGTQRTDRLLGFGAETVMGLRPALAPSFFAAFFALPEADWRGWLSRELSSVGMALAMARVFAAADGQVRRALLAAALADPWPLLRSLFPPALSRPAASARPSLPISPLRRSSS